MPPTITSEIVIAYAQCPRKAYLFLFSPEQGEPHEYVHILEQQRRANQERYLDRLTAHARGCPPLLGGEPPQREHGADQCLSPR